MEFLLAFSHSIDWSELSAKAGRFLLILGLGWLAMHGLHFVLERIRTALFNRQVIDSDIEAIEASKRVDTLVKLIRQAITIVISIMVLLLALREVGLDITPILASAGIVGLAVGFGAQNLVRDVISGFFMILEDQLRVGDVVIINGTGGLVEKVNFRTVVLRDIEGTVHTFPNGTISTLANKSTQWSAAVLDIGVGYNEDIDKVSAILQNVGDELRTDPKFGPMTLENIEVFGLDNFTESAMIIKVRLKTLPLKQWDVGREYRRRLKVAFDQAGVEIPFPQRVVHVSSNLSSARE